MIKQLLSALNDWLDRVDAREAEGMAIARRFNIALLAATKKAGDDERVLGAIARLAGQALQASDRDDLEALKRITAQLQEFV